ncbi:potassium channel subfamily K member 13a [Chanos chanos]|uniref:Potassium channel subfamily K member 13a n=1 Tax=Chanos chanos TaxID=29144 RepID=A0A6J2WIX9_CHACN|nr:potassium channel subfamily K member 13 [Chanos chanos]
MACRGTCCCGFGPVNEDNARFVMLALLIIVYLLCGAAVFSALEHPKEKQAKERWAQRFEHFSLKHNLSKNELEKFLRYYEEANIAGIRVDTLRPRWDFTGAFYFVGTVVSTIGFGMTTPATVGGKIFLIFYGLIGCAATILFFNLFLERIITVLAYVLKSCHEIQRRRKGVLPHDSRRDSSNTGGNEADNLAGWKPSVYCVMLILCVAAIIISCCASAMYSSVEGWGYFDSLYFCFVAFSTIGFGDMVSSQRAAYESQTAYRLGNFLFLLMGVCCIYSLFNVISIIIKQVLNWLLKKLEVTCRHCPGKPFRPRRNAVVPGHVRTRRVISIDTDAVNDSETDGRRLSGEMISMRDFLAANKVNLAIMQKQLSEMANGHPRPSSSNNRQNGFSGGVGALGIMNNRLAETSVDR